MMQVRALTGWLGAIALAAALAGCGATKSLPTAPVVDEPGPVIPQAPVAAPGDAATLALLARVKHAADTTANWKATARTDMINPDGKSDYNVAALAYKRPGIMAAEVVGATISKKIGTKLIYDGQEEVRVKTFFFGFLAIKVTLDVNDTRLIDAHKRSLKDTSTARLFETLFHPQAVVKSLGEGVAAGEPVDLLHVTSPLSYKGIVYQVMGISKRLSLPVLCDSIDAKGKRRFHLELKGMRTNVKLSSSDFSLD